jgi:N-methylhydantoinase B
MPDSDYFTREVIRECLVAMGDEMFTILRRTAHSPLIFETLDYAVGATDQGGELICMGNGVTGFLWTLDAAVKAVIGKFGSRKDIFPGDLFITNDPYGGGGSHLSDISLILPVFVADELIAFVVNKAHWSEVGGKDRGSVSTDATEVFQEGLQFPNVKLCERGQMNQALLEVLRANVRLPDMTEGDLWAGISALRAGESRILGLVRKYGKAALLETMAGLHDYGEHMARLELAKLPQGVFRASDWIDSDGLGNGPFEICCQVTIGDGKFVADFTGSHPQVPGSINTTATNLASRVRALYRAVTTPQLPTNGGMFRPLQVICPPRTIFSAEPPAPVSNYFETALMAIDLVWKALAPALPDRLTAGNLGSVCSILLTGQDPGEHFWLLFGPLLGGWGAGFDADGQSGQFCAGNGETYNLPVELTEARYGLLVEHYRFHDEPGGEGRFRGGKGVSLAYRFQSESGWMTSAFGRHRFAPWGVAGGRDGSHNYVEITRPDGSPDGSKEVYGKASRIPLRRGDLIRLVTAAGAGWGDPKQRDPMLVLADLENGFVTRDEAERAYGLRVGDGSR